MYFATLSAFDSDNNGGQVEHCWEMLPPSIPEGQPPDLDGEANDPGYANALAIRIPAGEGNFARALLLHSGSDLYVCFTDLKLPPNAQTPPSVGLRIDANASRDPLASQGDLGFFVNSHGLPWEEVGTGQGMAITAQAQHGFTAVIQRGDDGWSAEFRIAESLLGGWNHVSGLMFDLGTAQWPPNAAGAQPASWASAYLGATPPPPANRPPVANAGASQYVNVAEETAVYPDGSASFDPDGDSLGFLWAQVAGPPVNLFEATTATPHFVAPLVAAATTLRFQLVVRDGQTNSPVSETEITLLPTSRPALAANPTASQVRLIDGRVAVRLFGEPGARHIIEASSDLIHWETIFTGTADYYGSIDFMALDVPNYPARFYRALPALNDSFRNRMPLAGSSNIVFSLNRGATKEPGEPNHAGNAGGKSLWWSWTAPADGSVTISTIGSNFDTLLAVYAGNFLPQLPLIASDDDSGGNLTSRVSFNAVAGVTYQIAVDGFNGASGNIQLNLSAP
jgi:hypothetical protein